MGSMKSTSKRVVEGRVKLGFAVLASSEVDATGFVVGTWGTLNWWELEQVCAIYVGFWWRYDLRLKSKRSFVTIKMERRIVRKY